MSDLWQEQIAYYRARAGEYDQWFLREGRYNRGPDANAQWFREAGLVEAALETFAPSGRVLELACGTGLWTRHLVRFAESVTALDASPEVLAINHARVADAKVRYVEADLLGWTPDGVYDAVFFGFWLSHVPPERFDDFWKLVEKCLAPGGRVFFVDSLYDATSTAADHTLESADAVTLTRRLNDGQEFRIVKVFYTPEELAQKLAVLGWRFDVQSTANYFLYGWGERLGERKQAIKKAGS
jgi:SAM-dependent methyltransferase